MTILLVATGMLAWFAVMLAISDWLMPPHPDKDRPTAADDPRPFDASADDGNLPWLRNAD